MKFSTASFSTQSFDDGLVDFFEDEDVDCKTFNIKESDVISLKPGFIFTLRYATILTDEDGHSFKLYANQFASVADKFYLRGGKGIYMRTKKPHVPLQLFGGPIEKMGRLKYIDGCTDSLLLPPVKRGDPCLNLLHFPTHISQTQHTHPSHRIGLVVRGEGTCLTPFGDLPLVPGNVFIIKKWDGKEMHQGLDGKIYPAGQHSFETHDSIMDVVAWHPDSDFGPTDEEHPMINRTIVEVDGQHISAKHIDAIRTK